jgi:polyisoprenoid-binding protein YceI
MRTLLVSLAVAVSLASTAGASPKTRDPAQVPAGDYELDKRHASLVARVAHMGGFSRFTMRFDRIGGDFTYDPANWRNTKVTITVDTASVDTNVPGFDKQVAGFLGADKYPQISFVSTGLTPGSESAGKLDGQLTFHGVTKPISLDVMFNGVGPGLLGIGTRLGFSGTAAFKRSEFGADAMEKWAGDDVELIFDVEFAKK